MHDVIARMTEGSDWKERDTEQIVLGGHGRRGYASVELQRRRRMP
jgi:CRISPR/Cas system CSM-associated protein Csm3 (group 7 of RAMP superfamily)